jgi:hypothetical protein
MCYFIEKQRIFVKGLEGFLSNFRQKGRKGGMDAYGFAPDAFYDKKLSINLIPVTPALPFHSGKLFAGEFRHIGGVYILVLYILEPFQSPDRFFGQWQNIRRRFNYHCHIIASHCSPCCTRRSQRHAFFTIKIYPGIEHLTPGAIFLNNPNVF